MRIGGFQPFSMLDFPGKLAAIIFTQGCLFRCSYCHNPELVLQQIDGRYDENALCDLLSRRQQMLDGVVITGGEPTIQKDLLEFMLKMKEMGLLVKLDTNGWRPAIVEQAINQRLVDYIAMDIKAPWNKYEQVIKIPAATIVRQCMQTMRLIQESGIPHEFRTTVFPKVHTEDDIVEIASYLPSGTRYGIQAVRYEKTLDPNIDRTHTLNMESIGGRIRMTYPSLSLVVR